MVKLKTPLIVDFWANAYDYKHENLVLNLTLFGISIDLFDLVDRSMEKRKADGKSNGHEIKTRFLTEFH